MSTRLTHRLRAVWCQDGTAVVRFTQIPRFGSRASGKGGGHGMRDLQAWRDSPGHCYGHGEAQLHRLGDQGSPADICGNCGEEYVGEATTAHLLRTAEEVLRAVVEVDVREYAGP
jgi:hypothetical protein